MSKGYIKIQLKDGDTIGALKRELRELMPEIFPEAEVAEYVADGRLAGTDAILRDGSEVAMLFPMTGG